ncbi:uncharacterized protein LOC128929126 [Callithrix jacchus]
MSPPSLRSAPASPHRAHPAVLVRPLTMHPCRKGHMGVRDASPSRRDPAAWKVYQEHLSTSCLVPAEPLRQLDCWQLLLLLQGPAEMGMLPLLPPWEQNRTVLSCAPEPPNQPPVVFLTLESSSELGSAVT